MTAELPVVTIRRPRSFMSIFNEKSYSLKYLLSVIGNFYENWAFSSINF